MNCYQELQKINQEPYRGVRLSWLLKGCGLIQAVIAQLGNRAVGLSVAVVGHSAAACAKVVCGGLGYGVVASVVVSAALYALSCLCCALADISLCAWQWGWLASVVLDVLTKMDLNLRQCLED